jgi:hypothetical protein
MRCPSATTPSGQLDGQRINYLAVFPMYYYDRLTDGPDVREQTSEVPVPVFVMLLAVAASLLLMIWTLHPGI